MNFSFLFSKCQTEIILSKFIVQQSLDLIQGVQLSFPDELILYELIFYVANNFYVPQVSLSSEHWKSANSCSKIRKNKAAVLCLPWSGWGSAVAITPSCLFRCCCCRPLTPRMISPLVDLKKTYIYWICERIREWPVTDIAVWPLVNKKKKTG